MFEFRKCFHNDNIWGKRSFVPFLPWGTVYVKSWNSILTGGRRGRWESALLQVVLLFRMLLLLLLSLVVVILISFTFTGWSFKFGTERNVRSRPLSVAVVNNESCFHAPAAAGRAHCALNGEWVNARMAAADAPAPSFLLPFYWAGTHCGSC